MVDTISVSDGTEIFFKDWSVGQPIVFSHGSPLDSDAWNGQMLFLVERGLRVGVLPIRSCRSPRPPWSRLRS
jgi:non-heme chloroperoxidase